MVETKHEGGKVNLKKKGLIGLISTLSLAGVTAVTSIGVAVGTNKKTDVDNSGDPSINQTLYTVTFDTNGGTMADVEQRVTGGNTLTAPEVSKSGYDFLGWYTDVACTQKFDFNATPISSNITLYAKWGVACTVTFDTCDGKAVTTAKVVEGGKVSVPAEPHRNNYEFGGWYLDDEYQTEFDFDTVVKNNLTLFAKWNEIYNVLFNTDGGSNVTAQQVVNGNLATAPTETPTRGLDVFLGWYVNGVEFDFATPITKNTVITAEWAKDISEYCEFELINDESYAIGYYDGRNFSVVAVPKEHEGKPVTFIGSSTFEGHSEIETVIIPDGITEIGSYAFYECYNLKSIDIPASVKIIQSEVFGECYELKSLSLPQGITEISYRLFMSCYNLESVTIPNSVTHISQEAFYGCVKLTTIVLPNNLNDIGQEAFACCSGLQTIIIPASVTEIEDASFYDCFNLMIYCEINEKPVGWYDSDWDGEYCYENIYWGNQWHYDETTGLPTPNN